MFGIIVVGPCPSGLAGANELGFCGVTGVAGVGVGGCSGSDAGVGGTLAVEPFFAGFWLEMLEEPSVSLGLRNRFTFRSLTSFLFFPGFGLLAV